LGYPTNHQEDLLGFSMVFHYKSTIYFEPNIIDLQKLLGFSSHLRKGGRHPENLRTPINSPRSQVICGRLVQTLHFQRQGLASRERDWFSMVTLQYSSLSPNIKHLGTVNS